MALRTQFEWFHRFRWSLFAACCLAPAVVSAQSNAPVADASCWLISLAILGLIGLILLGLACWRRQYQVLPWLTFFALATGWLGFQGLARLQPQAWGWHLLLLASLAASVALFLLTVVPRQNRATALLAAQRYYFAFAGGALLGEWIARVTLVSLIEQLLIGMILGCLYALIALGYTLVYGVIKLINFAHGDIYMLGAFIGFYSLRLAIRLLHYNYGISLFWCWFCAVVISALICALLAVIMERLAYRPLRRSSRIAALITAVGVSFLLENAGIIVFKANPKSYEPKTFEVYQVQLVHVADSSRALQYEVYDLQQKRFAQSLFTAPTYAQVRVVTPYGQSPWTPPLTIDLSQPTGMVEVPGPKPDEREIAAPAILSYSLDQQGATEQVVLTWSPAARASIALLPVFADRQGRPLAVNLPLKRTDGLPLAIPVFNLVIIGSTIVLLWLLNLLISRSMFGISMRALSFDAAAAKLMGVNTDQVISITFAIGGACAAVAGNLVGLYNTLIDPLMGILPGLKALVAAVVGGIGSIPGAAAGGLIMGLSEALVKGNMPAAYSGLADAMAFAILILVLLFKPTGLFGSTVREKV